MAKLKIEVITPETHCIKCKLTKRKLTDLGLEFEEHKATPEEIESFREAGLISFPVVNVYNEAGDVIMTTHDFNVPDLNKIPSLQG